MSISTSTSSPKKPNRKQKRRKARSSSIFTAASSESSRADDELATAKAAAIKLLDHSSEPALLLDIPLSTPKAKRIRFEEFPTILEEQIKLPSQVEDTFHVSREEIFAESALVDAFQAAMNEFKFHFFDDKSQSSGPIRLPQSQSEQRRIAALYYGKPPPRTTTRSKKPPLHTIFLPRLIVAPSEPLTSEENATQTMTLSTGQTSPVVSDLDMDEYWDMVDE